MKPLEVQSVSQKVMNLIGTVFRSYHYWEKIVQWSNLLALELL